VLHDGGRGPGSARRRSRDSGRRFRSDGGRRRRRLHRIRLRRKTQPWQGRAKEAYLDPVSQGLRPRCGWSWRPTKLHNARSISPRVSLQGGVGLEPFFAAAVRARWCGTIEASWRRSNDGGYRRWWKKLGRTVTEIGSRSSLENCGQRTPRSSNGPPAPTRLCKSSNRPVQPSNPKVARARRSTSATSGLVIFDQCWRLEQLGPDCTKLDHLHARLSAREYRAGRVLAVALENTAIVRLRVRHQACACWATRRTGQPPRGHQSQQVFAGVT